VEDTVYVVMEVDCSGPTEAIVTPDCVFDSLDKANAYAKHYTEWAKGKEIFTVVEVKYNPHGIWERSA
jgi:hypothetical protein